LNFGGENVPAEIKVEGTEVNCGGQSQITRLRCEQLDVEFGIVKSKNGDQYLAYNVTLPGGAPLKQENLEHRQGLDGSYTGTVSWFSWRQGWGQIAPDSIAALPSAVQQKLRESMEAAAKAKPDKTPEELLYFRRGDAEWSLKPEEGTKVKFSVYTDDKGAGAMNIAAAE